MMHKKQRKQNKMSSILKGLQLNELSNTKLGDYKTAASADATAADKEGDYKRGDKRMSGIIKATKKEFANDKKKKDVAEAGNNYHANRTGFTRGARDDERHDLDTSAQVWGLKINGKVWSKGGKDVTFTSKQAALNTRNAILKNKPDLEIGLVTKGGVAEEAMNEGVPSDNDMGVVPDVRSGTSTKMTLGQWKQMWLKKMPHADQGMFRYPPAMNGSFIAYFDGWENTPGARWDPQQSVSEEQLDELSCWSGYHRVAGTKAGFPGSCAKNKTNEDQHSESCPHCGGEMVSEELMNEKKDACYYKVKSRYKVWPSAYASGALVKCRNKGAKNWGNGGKKNESVAGDDDIRPQGKILKKLHDIAYSSPTLTFQNFRQSGKEAIITDAIMACKIMKPHYLQNKNQPTAQREKFRLSLLNNFE
jgi:hypothetical protein